MLMDKISPKAIDRLTELGLLRGAENKPPQLTTLGEVIFERLQSGGPIPDLEYLA